VKYLDASKVEKLAQEWESWKGDTGDRGEEEQEGMLRAAASRLRALLAEAEEPNAETIAVMSDCTAGRNVVKFDTAEQMFAALDAEPVGEAEVRERERAAFVAGAAFGWDQDDNGDMYDAEAEALRRYGGEA